MAVIIPPPLWREPPTHLWGRSFCGAAFPLRRCQTTSVCLFLFHVQSLPVYSSPPAATPHSPHPPNSHACAVKRCHSPPGHQMSSDAPAHLGSPVPVCSHTCISLCRSVFTTCSAPSNLCLLHLHLALLDVLDVFQHASHKSSSYLTRGPGWHFATCLLVCVDTGRIVAPIMF